MSKKTRKQQPVPPTVITITLPADGGIERTGTLHIARGPYARLALFTYQDLSGVMQAVERTVRALNDDVDQAAAEFDAAAATDAPVDSAAEPLVFGQNVPASTASAADLAPPPGGQLTFF